MVLVDQLSDTCFQGRTDAGSGTCLDLDVVDIVPTPKSGHCWH